MQTAVPGCKPYIQSRQIQPGKLGPAWLPNADSNICFSQRNTTTASVCITQKQPIIRLRQMTARSIPIRMPILQKRSSVNSANRGWASLSTFPSRTGTVNITGAPQFGTAPDRNVNYDVSEHPDLWGEICTVCPSADPGTVHKLRQSRCALAGRRLGAPR